MQARPKKQDAHSPVAPYTKTGIRTLSASPVVFVDSKIFHPRIAATLQPIVVIVTALSMVDLPALAEVLLPEEKAAEIVRLLI
ncbi:hypothetical protein KBC03_05545 [Patescibacteria group bacterium]|nr:hypothetical protein [Patescibacteria group bacterium]